MRRILVTGGAGFIGSNLVKKLQEDYEVVVLDNFLTGSYDNLFGFDGDVSCADVSNHKLYPFGLKGDFDIVFHLASITDTRFQNDSEMMDRNLSGFRNMLRFSTENGSRFIYASSAGVYGNGRIPMNEEHIMEPLNAYSKSKAIMDSRAKKAGEIGIVGLRYFNVFGNNEFHKGSSASMVYQSIQRLKEGRKIELFEFGEQKRDFIHVGDVVSATIKAISAPSGVYNVGTGRATSFNRLVRLISDEMGVRSKINYVANPIILKYQNFTEADTSKSEKWLSFKAKHSLEDAIVECVGGIK